MENDDEGAGINADQSLEFQVCLHVQRDVPTSRALWTVPHTFSYRSHDRRTFACTDPAVRHAHRYRCSTLQRSYSFTFLSRFSPFHNASLSHLYTSSPYSVCHASLVYILHPPLEHDPDALYAHHSNTLSTPIMPVCCS